MPTNDNETPNKKTLREKVQSFRNKATRLLRMEKVNEVLQEIFRFNQDISKIEKNIERLTKEETSAEKITARAEYKMANLNSDDPDFEEKKVKAIAFIKTEKVRQESTLKDISYEIENANKFIEKDKKSIENLDKEIEEIESGETKVSIDEVNDLAGSLIKKS
jgi:chromosome segregation ATPase